MLNYITQNLKKNTRKFVIVFLMIALSTAINLFTMEVVSNLIQEMQIRSQDIVAQDDLEDMILMMVFGALIIYLFVMAIVKNIYSVLLMGRTEEFQLLDRLGFGRSRISGMLILEVTSLAVLADVAGILIEKVLSLAIIDRFDLLVHNPIPTDWILIYLALQMVFLWLLVLGDYRRICEKPKEKIVQRSVKKELRDLAIGILLIVVGFALPKVLAGKVKAEDLDLWKYFLFACGIWNIYDASLGWLLSFIEFISEKRSLNGAYYAAKQNLHNLKKIRFVVGAVVLVVTLFAGFKGLYASIEKTTEKYVRESVNYHYLLLLNDGYEPMGIEELEEKLNAEELSGGRYAIALTKTLSSISKNKEHALTLTGIDENYYTMQRFYVQEGCDINTIYDTSKLNVMFSSKEAQKQGLVVGDHMEDFVLDGTVLPFEISAMYDPINLKQSFTSRKSLSLQLYGTEDQYNALFLDEYTDQQMELIKELFGADNCEAYDMQEFAQTCVDQAVNGTEMIDLLIYVSMVFVFSLVINILVLSFGDRKRQYQQLRILGESRKELIFSVVLESAMVIILGSIAGLLIAIPLIKAMLIMVKEEMIFDTVMFIPFANIFGVLAIMLVFTICASFLIGNSCVAKKVSPIGTKE